MVARLMNVNENLFCSIPLSLSLSPFLTIFQPRLNQIGTSGPILQG